MTPTIEAAKQLGMAAANAGAVSAQNPFIMKPECQPPALPVTNDEWWQLASAWQQGLEMRTAQLKARLG